MNRNKELRAQTTKVSEQDDNEPEEHVLDDASPPERMISDKLWDDLLQPGSASSHASLQSPSTGTFSAVPDEDGFPRNTTSPEIHPIHGQMDVVPDGLRLALQILDSSPHHHTIPWETLTRSVKQALTTLLQHKDADNTQERDQLLGRIFYTLLTHGAPDDFLKTLYTDNLPANIHFNLTPPNPPKEHRHTPSTRHAPSFIDSEHEDLVQLELEADAAIANTDTRRALTTIQTAIKKYRSRNDAFGVARCLIRGAELLMTGDTYHQTASDWLQAASSTYQDAPSSHQRNYWFTRSSYNLCRLLFFQEHWDRTLETIDSIFDNTSEIDPTLLAQLLILRADAHGAQHNFAEERNNLLQALDELRDSDNTQLLLHIHQRLSTLFEHELNPDATHAHRAAALRIAYATNTPHLIVSISETLANTAEESGDLELAWDYAGRAFPHLSSLQDYDLTLRFFVLLLRIAPGIVDNKTLETLIHHAIPLLDALQEQEQKIELVGYLIRACQPFRTSKQLTPILPYFDECVAVICEQTHPHESLTALANGLAHISFYSAQHLENIKLFETAHRLFYATISLFTWSEHTAQALEAMCGVARCNISLGREEEALQHFEDILEQAHELGIQPVLLSAHLGLAQLYNQRGDLDKTTKHLLRTVPLQEQNPNPTPLGITFIQLADIKLDRAEIALARSTLHKPQQVFDSKNRGALLLSSEPLRKALSEATRFLSQARSALGEESSKKNGFYLACQGRILFLYGEFDNALQKLEDAIASTPARNEPTISVTSACRLAETLAILQRFDDARETLDLATEIAETFGSAHEKAILHRYRGRILYLEGTELRKAMKCLNASIKQARKLTNQRLIKIMLLEPYLTRGILKKMQSDSSNPNSSSLGTQHNSSSNALQSHGNISSLGFNSTPSLGPLSNEDPSSSS